MSGYEPVIQLKFFVWLLVIIHSIITFVITYYNGPPFLTITGISLTIFYLLTQHNITTKHLFGLSTFVGIEIFTSLMYILLFLFGVLATGILLENHVIKFTYMDWIHSITITGAFIAFILIKVNAVILCLMFTHSIDNNVREYENSDIEQNNSTAGQNDNDQSSLLQSTNEEYMPVYVQNDQGDIMMMAMPTNYSCYE